MKTELAAIPGGWTNRDFRLSDRTLKITLPGIACRKPCLLAHVRNELHAPDSGTIGADKGEGFGTHLINRPRAVDGPTWIVGVVENETCLHKLVHGLPPDGFP